jgi:Zn-dependent peptidase ImmA (M78 family)/transcriptional regulator with XRE-family HTH domain
MPTDREANIGRMETRVNFRMVRLAREMRGFTQTDLASDARVPQAVLSRIESGLRQASPVELAGIAQALALPVEFFAEPDTPAAAPLFRRRVLRSQRAYRNLQARINVAVLAARRILDAGIDIDTPLTFPAPGEFPRDDPSAAADQVRRAWRLPNGRVDSVTTLIENAGGIVLHVDFGTDSASAAFVQTLGDPRLWFLVNTRETAGDRVRLSLAHELGHAILHGRLPTYEEPALEDEAFEFAAALTLPADEFDRNVRGDLTLRQARDLKRAYWISIQAIMRAARDRGLITRARYTSLYKQISARGWRRDEPEEIPIEQPTIWPAALDVHRNRHGYTDDDLAQIARLSREAMHDLFPHDFRSHLQVVREQAELTVNSSVPQVPSSLTLVPAS